MSTIRSSMSNMFQDKPAFVRLLLDYGLRLRKVFKEKDLIDLYRKAELIHNTTPSDKEKYLDKIIKWV